MVGGLLLRVGLVLMERQVSLFGGMGPGAGCGRRCGPKAHPLYVGSSLVGAYLDPVPGGPLVLGDALMQFGGMGACTAEPL